MLYFVTFFCKKICYFQLFVVILQRQLKISIVMAVKTSGVWKVFSVKWRGHHYYVQEMDAHYGLGRDYAVMMDRQQLYYIRFQEIKKAVDWLLDYLKRDINRQTELELIREVRHN